MGATSAPSATDLRTIPLFRGFDDRELEAIGALFRRVTPAPTVLFEVGQAASDLYLLATGEVVLERPNDDVFRLHPPALIGELGALTGLPRSTRAVVAPGSVVWALSTSAIQGHLRDHTELAIRFLANLLGVVADKVHRDQARIGDMRRNLMRTQKELKRLRELVLEADETPLSAPLHDALDGLITHNRRVNYRVEPPPALPATLRLDGVPLLPLADLSRTHLTIRVVEPASYPLHSWVSGVLALAGTEIPISGAVMRATGPRITIVLDLLIDEYAAILESYLTRAQLLDVLV